MLDAFDSEDEQQSLRTDCQSSHLVATLGAATAATEAAADAADTWPSD